MFNVDPDSFSNQDMINAAHALCYDQEVKDPLLKGAGTVLLNEYEPNKRPRVTKAYYYPHVPGKPTVYVEDW